MIHLLPMRGSSVGNVGDGVMNRVALHLALCSFVQNVNEMLTAQM